MQLFEEDARGETGTFTLHFPVWVVKILIFHIHTYKVWHEHGWIVFNSKLKVFLIAKDEKQTSLRMSWTEAL